jgi:hypothetical protein
MFWALLETNLRPCIKSICPTQGPPQRRRVSTEPMEEGSGLNVNEALRAGARAGKFALSLGSFVGVMKHACVSLSPFVVHVFDRSVLLFASSFHSWSRGAWCLLVGRNVRRLCSKDERPAGKRRFRDCKFWNTEHCNVLQFLPTATKEKRNFLSTTAGTCSGSRKLSRKTSPNRRASTQGCEQHAT